MIQRVAARTLRALPRPTQRLAPSSLRFASSHSVIKAQTTSGLIYGSVGVVGLVGWTAILLSLGQKKDKPSHLSTSDHSSSSSTPPPPSSEASSDAAAAAAPGDESGDHSQSAAYNPETGEINWACPCLGGMADGPCGEDFKAAFSCFVYSEDEPKGVDCVDKFRAMQECFRKYPEIYGSDGDEYEEDTDELIALAEEALSHPDHHFLSPEAESK
ncbi:hypothetical protein RQP46_009345 [Phenoliferia psychrophenolica]